MAVDDHGLEVLKKSGEQVITGDKSDYYIKVGDITSINASRKQIAQARPSDTSNASFITILSGVQLIILSLVVANTSASTAKFRIFHDNDGSTFDESTALFWDINVRENSTNTIEMYLSMNESTGAIGIRSDTASALTFTAYGVEI